MNAVLIKGFRQPHRDQGDINILSQEVAKWDFFTSEKTNQARRGRSKKRVSKRS